MLSSKAKYGLKAVIHLARREGQGTVLIADIAQAECIPRKYLDAILLELKLVGFLMSKKGKGGGYALAKPAKCIFVGDIVRVLDASFARSSCMSRTASGRCVDCADEAACSVHAMMDDIREAIAGILDHATLADMVARKPLARALEYVI